MSMLYGARESNSLRKGLYSHTLMDSNIWTVESLTYPSLTYSPKYSSGMGRVLRPSRAFQTRSHYAYPSTPLHHPYGFYHIVRSEDPVERDRMPHMSEKERVFAIRRELDPDLSEKDIEDLYGPIPYNNPRSSSSNSTSSSYQDMMDGIYTGVKEGAATPETPWTPPSPSASIGSPFNEPRQQIFSAEFVDSFAVACELGPSLANIVGRLICRATSFYSPHLIVRVNATAGAKIGAFLLQARPTYPVIACTLYLVRRLFPDGMINRNDLTDEPCGLLIPRIFFLAMCMATKIIEDANYSPRYWASWMGISTVHLMHLELTALSLSSHGLSIRPDTYTAWLLYLDQSMVNASQIDPLGSSALVGDLLYYLLSNAPPLDFGVPPGLDIFPPNGLLNNRFLPDYAQHKTFHNLLVEDIYPAFPPRRAPVTTLKVEPTAPWKAPGAPLSFPIHRSENWF